MHEDVHHQIGREDVHGYDGRRFKLSGEGMIAAIALPLAKGYYHDHRLLTAVFVDLEAVRHDCAADQEAR